jgi:hypothetical protein
LSLIAFPFGVAPASIVVNPTPPPPPPPANIAGANFRDADLRGATDWVPLASTITTNTIRPDGSIQALKLAASETLTIRNNSIPISVTGSAAAARTSTLEFILNANWTSTIHFATGVNPALKGTLDLDIDPATNPAALIGQSFHLFAWNRTIPPGHRFSALDTDPGFIWDLSRLYTTGTVTLEFAPNTTFAASDAAIPEPGTLSILALGTMVPFFQRTRRRCRR